MVKATLEDLKRKWLEQIAKIENQTLNKEAVFGIYLHFQNDKLIFKMGLPEKELTRDIMLELDMLESKLTVALNKTEEENPLNEKSTAEKLFDDMVNHPLIKQASENHFKNEEYRTAVLDAMIRLEEMIKEKAKFPKDNRGKELSGVSLMHKVFDPDKPILSWCEGKRQIERDELEGYKHIFAGAIQGIRDPKAHAIFGIRPMRALKLLTLATLLAEIVDASKYMAKN
jgi:uncharacterized protein (TIGR02391 family)